MSDLQIFLLILFLLFVAVSVASVLVYYAPFSFTVYFGPKPPSAELQKDIRRLADQMQIPAEKVPARAVALLDMILTESNPGETILVQKPTGRIILLRHEELIGPAAPF